MKQSERFYELARLLKEPVDNQPAFNMSSYAQNPGEYGATCATVDAITCGTTCCIAGLACWHWRDELSPDFTRNDYFNQARTILGLDERQADRLFLGGFQRYKELSQITRSEAIVELERLAAQYAEIETVREAQEGL